MYSMQTSNGLGGDTINPAALSSTGMRNPLAGQSGSVPRYAPSSFLQDDFSLSHSTLTSSSAALANQTITPDTSPRGVKRSRSPDIYGDISHGDLGDDGESKPKRRGRPMKQTRAPGTIPESPVQSSMPLSQNLPPQTPQSQVAALPTQLTSITPTQASPPKATPTKTVIKALPTVRDHTTDQLGPEGDEYIPREYDDAGEKKVTLTGQLLEGRDYRCRTFFVPNRGDKLFMLATECARVLGYRDSYLLFNKNRSLYKIIATQAEKEDLIHQEILPFSYRSRQIAIVTARSMFRQFGSRVIVNGRRVRDDYWETKARKQGFTEEDLAGEKRPGAAKARESAAAEASATASMTLGHHGDIVYSNNPSHFGVHPQPQTVQPGMIGAPGGATTLPMITLAPEQPDMRLRDYSNIQRPRQEITGPPYQDRTQASPPQELLTHAHQAAEYNKQINLQRNRSGEYLDRRWRQPHELPPSNIAPLPMGSSDGLPPTQALPSPRTTQSNIQQSIMAQQTPQHLTSSQSYTQPPPPQHPIAQSPMRGVPPGSIRPDQIGRSPSLPLGSGNLGQGGNPYTFPQQGSMWPPGQGQQASTQQFSTYASHNTQPSPHIQQSPHQPPSQLRHSTSNPQMQPTLQYAGMQGMSQGYPAATRGLYQPDPNSQQFMQPSTSGPQPGASWAGQQPPASGSTWWAGQPQ